MMAGICILVWALSMAVMGFVIWKLGEQARLADWEASEREIEKWCLENGEEYT